MSETDDFLECFCRRLQEQYKKSQVTLRWCALVKNNILTWDDLVKCPDEDFVKLKNIGPKTAEILIAMKEEELNRRSPKCKVKRFFKRLIFGEDKCDEIAG